MKNLQLPRNRKKPSLRNSWLKSHPKPRSSTPEELVLAAPVNVSYVSWIGAQSGCCKIKIPKNTNMDQFWDPTIPSLGESQTISPEKKVLQLISRYLKYVARAPVASCRNILISHPKMVPSGGVPSHPGAPDIRIILNYSTQIVIVPTFEVYQPQYFYWWSVGMILPWSVLGLILIIFTIILYAWFFFT